MKNAPHVNWQKIRDGVNPPLLKEFMRLFNASDVAMRCMLRHGQVTIDGYIIREEHLSRWTPAQLSGRMARAVGREFRLYGGARVGY